MRKNNFKKIDYKIEMNSGSQKELEDNAFEIFGGILENEEDVFSSNLEKFESDENEISTAAIQKQNPLNNLSDTPISLKNAIEGYNFEGYDNGELVFTLNKSLLKLSSDKKTGFKNINPKSFQNKILNDSVNKPKINYEELEKEYQNENILDEKIEKKEKKKKKKKEKVFLNWYQ